MDLRTQSVARHANLMLQRLQEQVADLFGDLVSSGRELLIALVGVWLARLLFEEDYLWVAGIVLVGVSFAYLMEWCGKSLLPNDPVTALARLEWWAVAPGMIAALAVGLTIFTGLKLVPETLKGADKAIAEGIATALAAFLSAAFVKNAGDRDNTRLASRIMRNFYAGYKDRLKRGSPAETEMYGLSTGWGWADRQKRIESFAKHWPEPSSS